MRSVFQIFKNGSRCLSTAATGNHLKSLSVYAWGAGNYGVLGQGDLVTSDEYEPVPITLNLPSDVVGVGAGSFHSLAWTSEGQLYSWGRNKEGQLGRSLGHKEFDFSPLPLPASEDSIISRHKIQYATGSGVVTFAISQEGKLFVSGRSKRGQLGLGAETSHTNSQFVPVDVLNDKGKVRAIAAGWGHAIAIVDESADISKVYSWGWPANGRLGHSFAPATVHQGQEESEESLSRRCVHTPIEIVALRGVKCTSVACGMDSTYLITQDGRLLSFGDNSLGQLGRRIDTSSDQMDPSSWEVHVPRASNPRKDVKFARIAAGLGHCLAITATGEIIGWGWNTACQLGLGLLGEQQSIVYTPNPIFGVSKNRSSLVAAGRVHSVLVSDDVTHERRAMPTAFGHSWQCLTMCHTWGSAANGRLGTGTYEDTPFPELLSTIDGELVVDVAAGMDHTLLLIGNENHGTGGPLTAKIDKNMVGRGAKSISE